MLKLTDAAKILNGKPRAFGRFLAAMVLAPLALLGSNASLETAVANGDTRTLSFHHMHTSEDFTITFKRNGYFDEAALEKLNWGLRDWHVDEATKMDPRLFDILWEVYRQSGSSDSIHVVSAYRSPATNAALRRRSKAVAKNSQHILGKAMDFYLPDVALSKVRELGLRMQRGGVGYYPTGVNGWIHLDAGGVRYWPRMSRDQLSRVFPDGKTVFIPTDGQPMPGYDLALAEIEARGSSVDFAEKPTGNLFTWLFGSHNNEDADEGSLPPPTKARGRKTIMLAKAGGGEDGEDGPVAAPEVKTVAPAKPTVVASLELKKPTVLSDETADAPQEPAPVAIVPVPPARPLGLTQFALNGPLPPSRPTELVALAAVKPEAAKPNLAKPDLIAGILAKPPISATAVPGLIARGNKPEPDPVQAALAYAPTVEPPARAPLAAMSAVPPARPAPVAKIALPNATLVAARLDRAALRDRSQVAAVHVIAAREIAPPVTGLRQVAQRKVAAPAVGVVDTLGADENRLVSSFGGSTLSPLSTDHFTGPAVKALSAEDGYLQLGANTN